MTQAGLHGGFGVAIGRETLDAVREERFTIVRIDLQEVSQALTRDLAQEVIDAGLQPLCVLRRVEQLGVLPFGSLAEGGNEPDIKRFGWTKPTYRLFADAFWPEALSRGIRCYLGAYSSFRERTDWHRDLDWRRIPSEVGCSMHWYPGSPSESHLLEPTDAEVDKLIHTVGPRPLAISEAGYHDGPSGWSPDEVARRMANLRRFFARHGFDFVVGFQINDGPPDNTDKEAHFGFRKFGTTEWKPVTAAFTGAL